MNDSLGDRMKMYEQEFYSPEMGYVNPNMPVFVRLDGKAFHTWTKQNNFKNPFDENLSKAFQTATKITCEEIGQVLMAYSQSDEVTFLLNGWQKPESQVYFGGKIQKIVSVISSVFTVYFDKFFRCNYWAAFFDARVWNVPEKEIENVFIWRQMDAKRNSIQGLARSLYSHKELNGKSSKEMQWMCYNERDVDWNELSPLQKWGFVVYKESYETACGDGMVTRSKWEVDLSIPFFVDQRNYLSEKIKENRL